MHNDIAPKHILVDGQNITGVIDFEMAIGGDPVLDLSRWHFFFKDSYDVGEIIKGYKNKDIFTKDFDARFNLWRIYLGISHLAFASQEGNQHDIAFSKEEIINDVNYFNEHLASH